MFKTRMIAAFIVALMGLPAAADPVSVGEMSRYFSSFDTARSNFTQVAGDGDVSTGTLYLRRPGRARFEYDRDDTLVMAGGGQVAVFDGRSNASRPEQYPLSRTPLGLILASRVDLTRSGMLVSHTQDGNATRAVFQDPAHPDRGRLELVFSDDPVELRQWRTIDGGGRETTVILNGMRFGVTTGSSAFSIPLEIRARNR